jgi:hypothetical protein
VGDMHVSGDVGIGTSSPAYQLQLSTNSAAKPTSASWSVASDKRLKQDIQPYDPGLSDVLKINPVWFTYTGEAGMPIERGVGIIAQELQRIAPYMVNTWVYEDEQTDTKEEYLGVDNGAMTYMLINAIKDQQQIIDELKKHQLELEKDIEQLKNR